MNSLLKTSKKNLKKDNKKDRVHTLSFLKTKIKYEPFYVGTESK